MRSLERVNIRTNVRRYSHTYVRDRPYIPSTTLLCEGITTLVTNILFPQALEAAYENRLHFEFESSAVQNFFCGWCTVHIMLMKSGEPKNQNVYWYDYHVKNLIIVMTA